MPTFEIKSPEGKVYRVDGPDGSTAEQALEVLKQKLSAPNARSQPAPTPIDISSNLDKAMREEMAGHSWLANQWASAGSTFNDLWQRAKQVASNEDKEAIQLNRAMQKEAPVGAVVGEVAKTLPLAFVPGINTMVGGAVSGAAMGALQPTIGNESTLRNALYGGGAGALTTAATNVLPSTLRAVVRPFTDKGRQQIVGDVLNRFGGSNLAIQQQAHTPGWLPTLSEATGNSGIATLERGAASRNPGLAMALDERRLAQNVAAKDALEQLAAPLDAAKAARKAASKPLYDQAAQQGVAQPSTFGQYWPQMQQQIEAFLDRPSAKKALAKAKEIFKESDLTFDQAGSVRGLQLLKQGFDDLIERAGTPTSSIGKNELAAIRDSRSDLIGMIQTLSPLQRQADETFARLSQPVNEAQIAGYLRDKLLPAITDFQPGAPSRLLPNEFSKALRNADDTAVKATGYSGATFSKAMSPQAQQVVTGVAKDLANRAKMMDAARGVGSNTAQNLSSQQLIGELIKSVIPGPFSNLAETSIAQSLARPIQWAAKIPEQQIQDELVRALLNSKDAQKAIAASAARGKKVLPDTVRFLPLGATIGASQIQ